jgi:hypothetical protein
MMISFYVLSYPTFHTLLYYKVLILIQSGRVLMVQQLQNRIYTALADCNIHICSVFLEIFWSRTSNKLSLTFQKSLTK